MFAEPLSRLGTVRIFSSSGGELALFSFPNTVVSMIFFKITWAWLLLPPLVDGDPHFVVSLGKLRENLCFTVDGRANDVLRLLEDPGRGTPASMWLHS